MSGVNDWNTKMIAEFRANGGQVTGRQLLLLHTTGAKSGQERVNPLAYIRDGERLVVIASNEGRPNNPDWYYNVLAQPLVTVELGAETFAATASVPAEPERTRLFDQMVAVRPGFGDYQRKTTRTLPVVVLTRGH